MNKLPVELRIHLLQFIPLSIITSHLKSLSRDWKGICLYVTSKILSEKVKAITNAVKTTPHMHPKLLGNFDGIGRHPSAITSVEMELVGYNALTASLLFKPNGRFTSFGLWIECVGFIPIVPPEARERVLAFALDHSPILYMCFKSGESENVARLSDLPTTAGPLMSKEGLHHVLLKNSNGSIGRIDYEIESIQKSLSLEDGHDSANESSPTRRKTTVYPDIAIGCIHSVQLSINAL